MTDSGFTRDFQISLLANIMRSEDLMKLAAKTMTVDDLDIPVCKLIYESALEYYTQFNKLIPIDTLVTDVKIRVLNSAKSSVKLLPEEYEALAIVLERIATNDELDSEYYKVKLLDYIKYSRASSIMASQSDGLINPDNLMLKIIELHRLTNKSIKKFSIYSDRMYIPTTETAGQHVPCGVPKLDEYTYGGLTRGGIGMVTACPGVGKTTSLINFAYGANLHQDARTLLLTLELSRARIMHRWQGIAAGIPASYFKKPIDTWPDHVVARYHHILNPSYRLHNYFQVVDLSDATYTLDDVDKAIEQWLIDTEDLLGKEELNKCTAVYLDWFDMLAPNKGNIINGKKIDKTYELYPEMMKELRRISQRYNVALWTATQGTREADGAERVAMKHTAFGYHKNDALEIGIGVAVVTGKDAVETAGATFKVKKSDNSGTLDMRECSRILCYNINKNREGNTAAVELYQCPSLRLYTTESDWTTFVNKSKDANTILTQLLGG